MTVNSKFSEKSNFNKERKSEWKKCLLKIWPLRFIMFLANLFYKRYADSNVSKKKITKHNHIFGELEKNVVNIFYRIAIKLINVTLSAC